MKKRLLTGDRPTGKLHLGHYVGSIENRVKLQNDYDCFFIIADLHTLTTKPKKEDIMSLRAHVNDMVLDYLACGIDPKQSTLFLQSAVEGIYQLQLIFSMLTPINHLLSTPSIKEMAAAAHINEEHIPHGLLGYPVLQTADVLCCRADLVPVGKDNLAHIELSRDIAKRFNAFYGDYFPLPEPLLSKNPTLVGTDGRAKMSKSLNNAIFLSDEPKEVNKKVRGMYTDPKRVRADIPGEVKDNPVFIYHDIFNPNTEEVLDLKERYQKGRVGDVEVKDKLALALNNFLAPIREKRECFAKQKGLVESIIYEGTQKVQGITKEVVKEVSSNMGLLGAWKKIAKEAKKFKENHD